MNYKEINWKAKDAEEAFDYFEKLPENKKYPFLKWLYTQNSDIFVDWLEPFEEHRSYLSYSNNIALCEDFISWFPRQEPEEYKAHCEFIERDLCSYYLFKNDLPKLREHVNKVAQIPVQGIDVVTMKLYFQLLYHGHYEEALQYAKNVYKPLKNADNLMGKPENFFLEIIFINGIQNDYQTFKKTGEFSSTALNKLESDFKPVENESGFNRLIRTLQEPLDPSELLKRFKTSTSHCFVELQAHFLKYMLDNYGVPFMLSNILLNIVADTDFFGQSTTSDEFFYVDISKFDEALDRRLDNFFGSNKLENFGKVWGLYYIYEFLEDYELISAEDAVLMRENNNYFRDSMIIYAAQDLWQMNFVFKWPGNEHWQALKPMFKGTFEQTPGEAKSVVKEYDKANPVGERIQEALKTNKTERPSLQDWLKPQQPFVKTEPEVGRNDPCPCGSGKKYKKCCMNK